MSDERESEVREIISQTEISLVLKSYNDIFSSFDPRPYNERALSDDFLIEAKKAARDKREGLELHLLIPKDKKNLIEETLIKQRLKEHFRHRHGLAKNDLRNHRRKAGLLIGIGTLIGFVAVWLSFLNINIILKHAVEIIFSPASWFTIWTGFEYLTFPPENYLETELFYRKMIDAHITFRGY
jgi:hypothetical protein